MPSTPARRRAEGAGGPDGVIVLVGHADPGQAGRVLGRVGGPGGAVPAPGPGQDFAEVVVEPVILLFPGELLVANGTPLPQEVAHVERFTAGRTLALRQQPQPVLVASSVPDSPNIRVTRRWSVEVTDEAALITAAARNRALRKLLKVDLTALRRHVQATQGEGKIPGVTVTDTETLAVVTNGEG